ncbi:MAG: hypothetical protein U1C96_09575 [Gallionella sp.]|nr:hypothetical protein [Gallionella sp.]
MDEAAFRQRLAAMEQRPCAFAKAVLTRCVSCARSERVQIAEREIILCQSAASCSRCVELHDHLRHGFSFALKRLHEDEPLPHAQEMRIQCGGLKGLRQVMVGDPVVDDVDALLADAWQKWSGAAAIPYSAVVHAAALCYKGRHG